MDDLDGSGFFRVARFGQQLHTGLETIDIQPQRSVEFVQLSVGLLAYQAVMAHHVASHGTILLFSITLVVFLLRSPAGKGQVLSLAIGNDICIDKFGSIICVNPHNEKRKQGACAFQSSHYQV